MTTTTTTAVADPPHAVGLGTLAVPKAEIDSGRRGAVGLLDEQGNPVLLGGVRIGAQVSLSLALAHPQHVIDPELPYWHLLGVGRLFAEPTRLKGKPAQAIGVYPASERRTGWLHLPYREDLTAGPVWLEAHPEWPCPCMDERRRAWNDSRGEAA